MRTILTLIPMMSMVVIAAICTPASAGEVRDTGGRSSAPADINDVKKTNRTSYVSNVAVKPNLPSAEPIEKLKTPYDEKIAAQLNLSEKQKKQIEKLLAKTKKEVDDLIKKQISLRDEYCRTTTKTEYEASVKKVLANIDECKAFKPSEAFESALAKILKPEQATLYKDLTTKKP